MPRIISLPKLILSCQIRPGEPMDNQPTINRIIDCAVLAGIMHVRVNTRSAKYAKSKGLSIICLHKPVGRIRWINPDVRSVEKCLDQQPYAVAVESTYLLHPDEKGLSVLYDRIHKEGCLVVADVATLDDAIRAERLGADIVTTTLARIPERGGYCGNHSDHVALIAEAAKNISVPLIAEGGIRSPDEAYELLNAGATSVLIGYGIINPLGITRYFLENI